MPLAPEVTVIHEVLLDAVHVQAAPADTLIVAELAPRPTLRLVGEIEYEHAAGGVGEGGGGVGGGGAGGGGGGGGLLAACATVNVCPAIVMVPLRASLAFADTTYATLPLPVPDPPELTEIHAALLDALHAQPVVVETVTVPVLPPVGALALVGEIEYEHVVGGGEGAGGEGGGGEGGGGEGGGGEGGGGEGGGGGSLLAACVTVNARPAIVSVPVRAAPLLAATLNVTDPLPVPVAPAVTVIHDTLVVALH
jgi:uncharacterized membrane protein YgcG